MQVILENVRLSFPDLFTPKSVNGSEPKYGASLLIDKTDTKNLNKLKAAINAVASDKWPKGVPKSMTPCLRDGSTKEYEGYDEAVMFIHASNKKAPVVCNRKRERIQESDAQAPYAGCYVNVSIWLWAQDNAYGKKVNARLEAVQFVRDGETFGSAKEVDVDTVFKALEDESEVFDPLA